MAHFICRRCLRHLGKVAIETEYHVTDGCCFCGWTCSGRITYDGAGAKCEEYHEWPWSFTAEPTRE